MKRAAWHRCTTGPSAAPGRWAQPRTGDGAGRRSASVLQTAVELRLGEKRAGRLEDVVGLAQLLVLTLELLEAFALAAGQPVTRAGIDLLALNPFEQRLRNAPILGAIDSTAAHRDG